MSITRIFQYKPHGRGKGLPPELVQEVMRLHEEGLSNVQIGKIMGRHNSNIARLLNKMSNQSVKVHMNNEDNEPKRSKPRRAIGIVAPEDKPYMHTNQSESELSQRLAKLEQELREARLERDLYSEMIKVAEIKFGIQIIKKAGTKQ